MNIDGKKLRNFIGANAHIEREDSIIKGRVKTFNFPDDGGVEIELIDLSKSGYPLTKVLEWSNHSPMSKFFIGDFNPKDLPVKNNLLVIKSPRFNVILFPS